MRKAISAAAFTLALAAAAMPAFADYAEGDPRPMLLPTEATEAEVSTQTRQWLATAPTTGYPDGNPREFVQVGRNDRAQVAADAVRWSKSGMAGLAYGDVPLSGNEAAIDQARKSYAATALPQARK